MKGFLFIIGAIVLIILLTFLRVSTGSHNTTAPAPRPLTTPKVLAPAPKPTVKTTTAPTAATVVASHTFTGVGSWTTPVVPAGSRVSIRRPVGTQFETTLFRVAGQKDKGDETCTFIFMNNTGSAKAFQVTCK